MSPRSAGVVGAVGAGASTVAAGVVATIVVPASTVPTDRWSFPWSAAALVPVSLLYAVFHVLVLVGLLGLARGRVGRVGARIAVAGTAVLTVAELASIPFAAQRMDEVGPGLVAATFGLGTVVSAAGFVTGGVAIVRARRWAGWRRYVLLVTGIWTAVMLGLVATPALPVAVGVYGLLLTGVFVGLATAPDGSAATPDGTSRRLSRADARS